MRELCNSQVTPCVVAQVADVSPISAKHVAPPDPSMRDGQVNTTTESHNTILEHWVVTPITPVKGQWQEVEQSQANSRDHGLPAEKP